MFTFESENREFGLKPMNCPGHCALYSAGAYSYRELPLRVAEAGVLHRDELAGALHGLLRVRMFSQDDAHVFCTPEQVEDEVLACLDFGYAIYDKLGLEINVELSTRPENRLGADEEWDAAEAALSQALERRGLAYAVNEGDGAFYGPKIDFDVTDAIGRKWQCATIQLDYQMPERFDLKYIGADNAEHRVVVIHRAIFGSFERFIAILIEHYAGAFPLWLAPLQAIVLPISDRHLDYGGAVRDRLAASGLRATLDERQEKIGYKIREAQLQKVPYMLVVGDRESAEGTVAVRTRRGGDQGSQPLAAFIDRALAEVRERTIDSGQEAAA
jgi:threonyl-tRNA synthetase